MALSKGRIRCLVTLSLLEILIYGGLQYGWSSILFVLKAEGLFQELCQRNETLSSVSNETANVTLGIENPTEGCFQQDERFNLIFSIGMAALTVTNVASGQMHYKFGRRRTRIIKILIFVAGLLLMGFSSPELPWLVLPGLVCVGVAGLSLLISDIQIALLLTNWSAIYVGVLNGFYDSSVLTERVVKILYEHGIKRLYSYSGIAVLVVVISGLGTFLFPSENDTETKSDDAKNKEKEKDKTISTISKPNEFSKQFNNKFENKTNLQIFEEEISKPEVVTDSTLSLSSVKEQQSEDEQTSIGDVICSRKYLFHVIWLSVMMLRLFFFLGSINRIMEQILDSKEKVSHFTDVMAYTMMGGCISSYFSGQLLHWQNNCCSESLQKVLPLSLTSSLAVLLSAMTFINDEDALYGTFVVLTVFRSFMFSVNMDFIMSTFPKKFIAVLFGLALSVAGSVSMLQYALFVWTEKYDDALKHVNGVLLGLSVLSLVHPLFLFIDAFRLSSPEVIERTKL